MEQAAQAVKRFYKQALVTRLGDDRFGIMLDSRPVKTPSKALLAVERLRLAEAIAGEWADQGDTVNPHAMPFTGLANAVIDIVAPDPAAFGRGIASYAESELLCYRATDDQADLTARQEQVWGPVLAWARTRYDIGFTVVAGVMHQPQPGQSLTRLRDAVLAQSVWTLAALQPIITITGSCVLGLAIAEGHLAGEAAFDIAHLDELWQAEQWGEDHFALQTREAHRTEMLAAVRFLELCR